LAILWNYRGEASAPVALKEVVSRYPNDERKMNRVRDAIFSTGVVWGELGVADSWRAKKRIFEEWLQDERPEVKAFATQQIAAVDLMIASEVRRVETEREMRRRNYDEPDAPDDEE
jgi:hypothetical protein